MKTKVIEAMSYGKSIIGTDEAFQGIECDFSRIGAKCNTAEEFIKAIESLSDNLFNPYTYQVFSDKYETSTVENRLKSFMTTF
jgi:tetrahydromethanopterin S-methyltransferase subunit H